MNALISAHGLSAGYGARAVVHELNFDVQPGEIVLLLGPNGAGKTTTMLTLSGILPTMSGRVLIDGQPARGPLHRRCRRGLAYLTEERSVLRTLSAADNIRCGGVDADDVLSLFPELQKSMRTSGGLLSGGEQQMLALGCALARKPRLLLADELSLGLAPLVVTRLFEAVTESSRNGMGVLLVEQHARTAMRYCDRVLVLSRGRLQLSLSAAEARERMDEIQSIYLSRSPSVTPA